MSAQDLLSDEAAARLDGRQKWLSAGAPAAAHLEWIRGKSAEGAGSVGAIASGSPHATRAGYEMLERGGTAGDAAAAAAFATMVADPPNASPAGRGHILWAPAGGTPQAIDGATVAPSLFPEDASTLAEDRALPLPGIVRAVLRLHAETGRLPLAEVAAPARRLALDGFEVPAELARIWAWRAPLLCDPDARRHYLPEGSAPASGALFSNPGLAAFFDRLIETGRDPFTDPSFATPFCARLAEKGAFWTVADLRAAEPLRGETVSLEGPGWRLTSIGRQGWGHTLLRIVGLVNSAAPRSALEGEIAHLQAILRAFEERPQELRSLKPKENPLPWTVLSARFGDPLPRNWSAPRVLADAVERASLPEATEERDTTHLSVIDRQGMRVALTQSIGPHFGARVADPETGILLAHSYRMAEDPTPGARDVTEQCPCLLDLPESHYALGGAGSERIPGAVAAVIRNLLAGETLAAALAAPRSNWVGVTARLHIDVPAGLEDRLAAAGARTEFTGRGPVDHLGIVQAAGRKRDGSTFAAADPAYSGSAAAG